MPPPGAHTATHTTVTSAVFIFDISAAQSAPIMQNSMNVLPSGHLVSHQSGAVLDQVHVHTDTGHWSHRNAGDIIVVLISFLVTLLLQLYLYSQNLVWVR